MPATVKNTTKDFSHGTDNAKVKNYDNDPFVIKKVEEATKTLQRVGLPNSKKNL